MEELEKWAQEKFIPSKEVRGSYLQLREKLPLTDPSTFDLPYDTIYDGDLILTWHPAVDILNNKLVYVPTNLLTIKQDINDILFSPRGARKVLSTNGLGAGFSREEAVLHGLCEYVERHAQRMAELRMTNPGCAAAAPQAFVRLEACGPAIRQLYKDIAVDGSTIRVLDITSEIGIPTFLCVIMRNFQRAEGYGTHPNAIIAIEMAMLEAYQTIASHVAGGREDLSIKARSLGRHERPRPISAEDGWFWLNPDATYHDPDERKSFVSGNVLSEIDWSLGKIGKAGCDAVVVIDITAPEITPAHVVKVLIPGLETNSPFYLGPRGRAALIADIVPATRVLHLAGTAHLPALE
jgi:ribosomal protein S12 methylthiotransferase accessory factor